MMHEIYHKWLFKINAVLLNFLFQLFSALIITIRNVSWAADPHIRMISEGSCDPEDWSNDCWKFSFDITGINYILKFKM